MARTQTVTIPLEEYKELLLRDRPSEHEKEVLAKLLDIIAGGLAYVEEERGWYSSHIGNHLECEDANGLVKEAMTMLKYVDMEIYMRVWNSVMTRERERKAKEAMVKQMNMAREIRAEQED